VIDVGVLIVDSLENLGRVAWGISVGTRTLYTVKTKGKDVSIRCKGFFPVREGSKVQVDCQSESEHLGAGQSSPTIEWKRNLRGAKSSTLSLSKLGQAHLKL
jgi:hypothetical protein